MEIILPKVLYIILLLLAWIAALFSGIAFVYGIQLRKRARDFPSDEGTYHSRMIGLQIRPFLRSFFITKICLTELDYTCSIKEKDYSCRL